MEQKNEVSPQYVKPQIVTSTQRDKVNLTVYRDPNRGQRAMSKNWPQGYAMVSETRTVTIPAGEAVIRFENVAEGMFPESAIISGLPNGVREKNMDARLLSPAGLVDAYLKRQVTITRTDKATGKSISSEAMITAGPFGGVILESEGGFEALHCTGLPERMSYGGVPEGLSAKPTLSVQTISDKQITATLTITYLSAGFDWDANYIAEAKPIDGKMAGKVDIFGWMTVANGGATSFDNANLMAVAGQPNRERSSPGPRPVEKGLNLKCWPTQRTHEIPYHGGYTSVLPPPPPPAPPMAMMEADAENIVVTGARIKVAKSMAPIAAVVAVQENLGDLKLYHVPILVNINAKGQKQVAMIVKPDVKYDHIYRINVDNISAYYNDDDDDQSKPIPFLLKSMNKTEDGLGLPLPAGRVAIFENSEFGPLWLGESSLTNRAVGDEVEVEVGESSAVRITLRLMQKKRNSEEYRLILSNALPYAVRAEVEIPYQLSGNPKSVRKIDGIPTWEVVVPANDEVSLIYKVKLQ
ncbi:hypothetical protein LPB140_10785 [Sphingorhabdus lutea]|uniref:DUF4139 domain-containing protein n=1 Tax=Sphingorhabdus lutea TaxID=1913578 RepID=A0A1L3JFC6_9SPHN|nr:hypothetical protein LPB140_10785 [Sphingorhabdus lutea]